MFLFMSLLNKKIWDGLAIYPADLLVNCRDIVLLANSPHGNNGRRTEGLKANLIFTNFHKGGWAG